MQLGSALYLGGAPESALEPMETALSLSPQDSQIFCVLAERGMVRLMLGDHDGAIESAELALIRRPAYWYAHLIKIAALVRLGRRGDARAARADLYRAKPAFRPEHVDWLPFGHPRWPDRLKQGFHDAEK
jgi:tetratricopeptide (TPR) repeat protein